jgi:hypothetical protein
MWWMTWRAPLHCVVEDVASTSSLCNGDVACTATLVGGGTLHKGGARKRSVWLPLHEEAASVFNSISQANDKPGYPGLTLLSFICVCSQTLWRCDLI